MARALGTREDRSPSGASGAKPSLPVWRTPKQWPEDWLGVGEARVRLPQLLFVFFLLGSFPKQTNQGGKMKGTWRRGKCQAKWLDPGTSGHPRRGLQLELYSLLVPCVGKIPNWHMTPKLDSWEWKNTSPSLRKQQQRANMSVTYLNAQVPADLSPAHPHPPQGLGWPDNPSWCHSSGVIHQVFMLQGWLPGPLLGQQ